MCVKLKGTEEFKREKEVAAKMEREKEREVNWLNNKPEHVTIFVCRKTNIKEGRNRPLIELWGAPFLSPGDK